MSFPLNVYLAAAASAFLTTLVTLPLWRSWCRRVGLVDDPGPRKIHQQPIPLAGGLAIITGLLVPLLAGLGLLFLPVPGVIRDWIHVPAEVSPARTVASLLQYGFS